MKRNDEGFSLLAVILITLLVTVLVATGITLAYANFNMKTSERNNTNTFYSADSILNEIKAGVETDCKNLLAETYTALLYSSASIPRENLDDELEKVYMLKLQEKFTNENILDTLESYIFVGAKQDIQSFGASFVTTPTVCYDDTDKKFAIQNIGVSYLNESGLYSSTIVTDIAITSPSLFGTVMKKETAVEAYSNYALIADEYIKFEHTQNIHGSVYAGNQGIDIGFSNQSNINVDSGILHTREDINIYSGSSLTGNNVDVYADSIYTKLEGSLSTPSIPYNALVLHGNTYIKGDISLNVPFGNVLMTGRYYGYTPRKSAFVINASNVDADLQGIESMLISGVSYIDIPTINDESIEVLMGESLTGKFTQSMYLVPSCCIYRASDNEPMPNPINVTDLSDIRVDITKNLENGGLDLTKYVDASSPYYAVEVCYKSGSSLDENRVYLYLRFKSINSAASYSAKYADFNEGYIDNRADSFRYGNVYVSPSSSIRTAGNIITNSEENGIKIIRNNITSSSNDYILYREEYYGSKYISLCSTLQEGKTTNLNASLYEYLINKDKINADETFNASNSIFTSEYAVYYNDTITNDYTGDSYIILVAQDDVYIKNSFTGVVITNGNIYIDSNVTVNGCLISGGTIDCSLAPNCNYNSMLNDESPLMYMLNHYTNSNEIRPYFKQILQNDNNLDAVESIDLQSTITFERWFAK